MKEFRYVGNHSEELNGGRPIAPGEYTGPIAVSDHNKILIEEGRLLEVPDGTAAKVAEIDRVAVGLDPIQPDDTADEVASESESETKTKSKEKTK